MYVCEKGCAVFKSSFKDLLKMVYLFFSCTLMFDIVFCWVFFF